MFRNTDLHYKTIVTVCTKLQENFAKSLESTSIKMQEVQTHLIVSSPEKQEYKNISPPIYYILLKDAFQTRTY